LQNKALLVEKALVTAATHEPTDRPVVIAVAVDVVGTLLEGKMDVQADDILE